MSEKIWATIRLDSETKSVLMKLAEERDRSFSSLVALILKDYVKKQPKGVPYA